MLPGSGCSPGTQTQLSQGWATAQGCVPPAVPRTPSCHLYPRLSPVPWLSPIPQMSPVPPAVACLPSCPLSLSFSSYSADNVHAHLPSCFMCSFLTSHANCAGCHEKQVGVARGHPGPSSVSLQPTAPQKPPPSTAKESQTNTKTPPSRFTELLVLQQHWTDSSKSDLPWRYSSSKQVFSSGIGTH